MIKVETKTGNTSIEVIGTLPELCADTIEIVRAIYSGMKDRSKKHADVYKEFMEMSLCDMAFADNDDDITSAASNITEKLIQMLESKD